MIKKFFSRIPEPVKQPLRRILGKSHPFGLALSERRRLAALPRYQSTTTMLFGRAFRIADPASFLASHHEIFHQRIYQLPDQLERPVIVDVGANLGLASIELFRNFPSARIIAIESDPQICDILRDNFKSFGIANATVLQGAAWDHDGTVQFLPDRADAGRVVDDGGMEVNCIRLRDLIVETGQVDFLKMDIEGAELRVLTDCQSSLTSVQKIFVEYHSIAGQPQRLSELLQILERSGFRYYVQQTGVYSPRPLERFEEESGFDLQLNIFAVRTVDL